MKLEIKYKDKNILNLSNLLSFIRLLLAIPLWIFIQNLNENDAYRTLIISLLIIAFLSDILDGIIARRFNQITEFGKIIDPLADKIVIAAVLIQLFLNDLIPEYFFYMVVGRDVFIIIGGIYVSNKLGIVLSSNKIGKITVLSISIVILLKLLLIDESLPTLYSIFYFLSVALIFISLGAYALRAFETIKWRRDGTT